MNPERLRQIEDLFTQASGLPPSERLGHLQEQCGEDADLLHEVSTLLAASRGDESFLRTSVASAVGLVSGDEEPGPLDVGLYRTVRRIGTGGMGTVYLAERADSEFTKQVAIKVIRQGASSEEIVSRFLQERQVLAQLEHPNIARLIDGGVTEFKSPYLVMEYVDGVPIDTYCKENSLSVRERIELFRKVCAAVHYAHQSLVIHRDLKPHNILVTSDGEPKLLDFGIAKVLDESPDADVTVTQDRRLTPQYASPEQARGERITTASDVYSLGVILYEILTGERPYDFSRTTPMDYARVICQSTPERPSTVVTRSDPEALGMDGARVRKRLAGDLDNITLMALRKEPERRYASAMELSEDLRRYLAGLTVSAREDTIRYRTTKFVRRNPIPVAAGTLSLLVIVVSLAVSIHLLFEAREANRRDRQQSYIGSIVAAREALPNDEILAVRSVLDRAPEEHRNWEWSYLGNRCDDSLRSLEGHEGRILGLAVSPDESRVVSTATDGTVRVWDPRSGQLLRTFPVQFVPMAVRYHPGGDRFLVSSARGPLHLLDAETGSELAVAEGPMGGSGSLVVTPDGSRWVSAGFDRKIRVWDIDTLECLTVLEGHTREISSLDSYRDSIHIVSGARDGTARIWNIQSGEQVRVLHGHDHTVEAVAFDSDGTRLATAGQDNKIILWNPKTGEPLKTIRRDRLLSEALFLEGESLISAGGRSVDYWSTTTGQRFGWARGNSQGLSTAVMGPRRSFLATGDFDGVVRIFDRYSPAEQFQQTPGQQFVAPGKQSLFPLFDRWGERLFVGAEDGTIRVYDCDGRTIIAEIETHRAGIAAMGRIDSRLLSLDASGLIATHDTRTGNSKRTLRIELPSRSKASFDPQGKRLAVSSVNGGFRIVDVETGNIVCEVGEPENIKAFSFDGDGRRLVTSSLDGGLHLWNARTGDLIRELATNGKMILSVAFSPDGSEIATGSIDGNLRTWKPSGEFRELGKTRGMIFVVSYTPDGKRIILGDDSTNMHIWDPVSGVELVRLMKYGGWVRGLAVDPTGRWIAAVGGHVLQLYSAEAHRQTVADSRARMKLRPDATALVERLLTELGTASLVADRLEADEHLSGHLRHEAINALLRRNDSSEN